MDRSRKSASACDRARTSPWLVVVLKDRDGVEGRLAGPVAARAAIGAFEQGQHLAGTELEQSFAGVIHLRVARLDRDAVELAVAIFEQDRHLILRQILRGEIRHPSRGAAHGRDGLLRQGCAMLGDDRFHIGDDMGLGDQGARLTIKRRHRGDGLRRQAEGEVADAVMRGDQPVGIHVFSLGAGDCRRQKRGAKNDGPKERPHDLSHCPSP
ncbi:hypothetical protein [Mesorhizobium retamae]|uniref:Uncharacterized protein n=1 Tax=Mesorhizobium retamae TaxID=2912854 RepID=A0ABS9QP85_9HYPH|nr:hypothetical protein [Mesorhizobium sp. IRAMC:0171]MCG7509258.1 hypothetical protein [Mesorhizobium sp. IRAMC:0171]